MANYYQYKLTGGVPTQVPVSGKLIVVDSIGAANGVDITPMLNNGTGRTMPNRRKGFKCWVDFDGLVLQSEVDTTVALFLSVNDVSLGFTEGAQVNVAGGVSITNDASARVPVDIAGSNIQVTATNVGISNTEATAVPVKQVKGATVVDRAPTNVSAVVVQALAADATRRAARIRNLGPETVALVGSNLTTFANAAVTINAGETWLEDDAPGAAWFVLCDAGNTAVLNIQEIKQ
jgi:hypothetical protein